RGLVSDDENNQACGDDAFAVLNFIASRRLAAGKLTVIDATNVQMESRRELIELARRYHVIPVAIVFNLPPEVCHERNASRPDRQFGPHVVRNQNSQLQRSLRSLRKEGITNSFILNSVEEVNRVKIERTPLWNNLKHEKGPFDIIGDVHGCFDELAQLLEQLGYKIERKDGYTVSHPENRKVIFVGDLVDRGPATPEVLRLVMDMVKSGTGFCVVGNHDDKLKRKLQGRDVKIAHGLAESLEQLDLQPEEFKKTATKFLDKLISHLVFDEGKLAVAHAGIKDEYIGRGSPRIREFCMYGETTGEIDEFGLPVRYPWARDYRGKAMVVYGHTPIPEPEWVNNTINIDTGCVFGGKLTALRYPERELVSVPAAKIYCEPIRPLQTEQDNREANDVLDINDVIGRRIVSTKLHYNVTIREENAIAALEVMSRFAIDPRWLIYLPPTMSPTETSKVKDLLEHPDEAFSFFHKRGVTKLICEEKHMGSRAIVVVCRDNETARKRFGVNTDEIGACYTRTGRSFFNDKNLEQAFLTRIGDAMTRLGWWEKDQTDWYCLDCELMPWSAKAQGLLEQQYAPVGAAALVVLSETDSLLEKISGKIAGVEALHEKFRERHGLVQLYRDSYRRYCWPVTTLDDYKLAPFHVLASENSFNMDRDHLWHVSKIDELCDADPKIFRKTTNRLVDTENLESVTAASAWWTEMTANGGEGMVVKPVDFTVMGKQGLIQPGIKCRGREYLRIIYGPEYTVQENLERLRKRGLGLKRSLALREYALGYEALQRFVNKEPLYRVHEAVFGVLALESEPVDPRL
ncbi:MAG: polynucleotide kinase-phosphatase, partial [Rhodobacteraceae bacterium]|nr:polynucleotide kinase-phosphatase [Paracoccaceae bacterium]